MQKQNIGVEAIIRETIQMLERQGYDVKNRKYKTLYRAIAQFSQNGYEGEYSHEIGEAFLRSLQERKPPLSDGFFRAYALAVERANHVLEGDTDWYPQTKEQEYAKTNYPKEMVEYEEYLRNSGKEKWDVRSRMHIVSRFLRYVDSCGVARLSEIKAQHIFSAFEESRDKIGFHKSVGSFLRYAHRYMLTTQDLSVLVPTIKRHSPVPTVYTPEEVEKIIEFASQSKVCGKRNRAIVLIAARLGLRSCDIAKLCFKNINYGKQAIVLMQSKTGEPIELPLLPEIREALEEYVKAERQNSDNDRIFLNSCPPLNKAITPNNIYTIVSRIISASGVATRERKRGAHALRSSLATALLNEGNDYLAIQGALGQKSPNSVKSYARTDVEHLRPYALSVPKPSGSLAAKLGVSA